MSRLWGLEQVYTRAGRRRLPLRERFVRLAIQPGLKTDLILRRDGGNHFPP